MKKVLLLSLLFTLLIVSQNSRAQGLENFNNYANTGIAYKDSTFLGQDGSTWHYYQCRGDSLGYITAPTPTLGKDRIPTAEVISGTITGGCGTLSFQYKQVFSTGVSLDVFVNGLLFTTVTSSNEVGIIKNSGDISVNQPGNIVFDFKQHNTNSGQVAIDNITWTAYSGNTLPEPTDYPTMFTATPGGYKVTLTWTDAAGTQPPTAYLIKASGTNNITDPVDLTPVANDPDLSDGSAAINIVQGIQTYTFEGLLANTPYYFKIYPYTNTGNLINYKTDGTVPSATATTPNTYNILSTTFNDFSFDGWTAYNVSGTQVWTIDSIHGVSSTGCAKMSGYASGNFANEDWLISPAMNFDQTTDEVFTFMNAYNYTGNPIQAKGSTNYDGTSDPNTATWTDLTSTLSPGGWAWTSSGDIDVSQFSGTHVYLAFKYTSTTTASSTWELDNLLVTGIRPLGIPEKIGNEFIISPNPTQGAVVLTFPNQGNRQVEVYSILGNKVYSADTGKSSVQLDLSGMTKGIYLVRISDQQGSNPVIKKVILK